MGGRGKVCACITAGLTSSSMCLTPRTKAVSFVTALLLADRIVIKGRSLRPMIDPVEDFGMPDLIKG